MTRVKAEMKCPYCDEVKAVSGMTSHVRAKHTEHYEEFKKNRLALVEKYKIIEGQPAADVAENATTEIVEEVKTVTTKEPEPTKVDKPDAPAPKEQQSGSFLSGVRKALRDW